MIRETQKTYTIRPILFTLIAVIAAMAVLVALMYRQGTVRISVASKHDDRGSIRLALPASAIYWTVKLIPDEGCRELSRDLGPILPALEEAGKDLGRYPNTVFVEILSKELSLTIRTEEKTLLIEGESPGETLSVSFPVEVLSEFFEELQKRST